MPLTNVAYKEAAMATIEVIFSPALAQSQRAIPIHRVPPRLPGSSSFHDRRGIQ
jgi:hypothetical protein